MRFDRRTAAVGALGAVGLLLAPDPARAGLIPVTLAAGLPGSQVATTTGGFRIPVGGPVVAVDRLAVGDTATAATGGGRTFFGGAGVPVLLDLSDGGASLASSNAPADTATVTPASASPRAGGEVPPSAVRLGVALADPASDGTRALTARVTDAAGTDLGGGWVEVPAGGWWVIGLGPADLSAPPGEPPPLVDEPPAVVPDGPGADVPSIITEPVTTPEPGTALLVAAGLPAAALARWTARRRAPTTTADSRD